MRILKFLNNRSVGDRKGQVAIFVALIFQLLFLFFAMVVNVGLLVHHKINLQNSVDLAAYYGGMKQAEVLNAIAHINYQIRQSYKVLDWRYRVLGTAGVYPTVSPGDNPVSKGITGSTNPQFRFGSITNPSDTTDGVRWPSPANDAVHLAPAFCLNYQPFIEAKSDENTCQRAEGLLLPPLAPPTIIAGFVGAIATSISLVNAANDAQKADCDSTALFNYAGIGQFIAAYLTDQAQRKLLIFHLANGLSNSTTEFLDIEGSNVSDGIRQTFKNNLTAANLDGQIGDVSVFNSLATGDCGGVTSDTSPPKWLREVSTFLFAEYMTCSKGPPVNHSAAGLDSPPPTPNPSYPALSQIVDSLKPLVSQQQSGANKIYNGSLGVEKNPWCMAYVGVTAQSEPKIPFSLGTIRLKATSFAKPFGGKIGPWYGPSYPRLAGGESAQPANLKSRTDALVTYRCPNNDFNNCKPASGSEPTINHSRFPGDQVGFASYLVQGQYGKSIFDLQAAPSFAMWDGISQSPSQRGGETDILAWDNSVPSADSPTKRMRDMEISAAAPDLFDITYYSIDPDFYNNYFVQGQKLDKYLNAHPIQSVAGYVPPMDIGSRRSQAVGSPYSISFSIVNQLSTAVSLGTTQFSGAADGYGLDYGKLGYAVFDTTTNGRLGKVLTSWVPPEQIADYELAPSRFGKCDLSVFDGNGKLSLDAVPGSCIVGGRAGYSVKIISSDYLLGDHSLGGPGVGKDKILNLPPPSFLQ